jgi:uncharacterized protein YvpB
MGRRILIVGVALLLAACSLPNTGAAPETRALPAPPDPTSTPAAPAILDTRGVIQTAEAIFPQVPGKTTFYDCSTAVTLFNCPLTDRLHNRLQAAQINLCNCKQPSPDRKVTAELEGGRGIAHVRLYGGLFKVDLIVVPVGERLLVDDERLTGGGPETSIHAVTVEVPAPKPPDEPKPVPRPGGPLPDILTVPVPVIAQVMNLDCETAALQMGLATFGKLYSQPDLFKLEAPDLRPAETANGRVQRWGNPYTHFVGDVNGLETNMTGYGVYWPVILAIARSHGRPGATGGNGLTAKAVYQALATGHPVEVWVETGFVRPWTSTWVSWDGKTIPYSLHEHAVTLSGVSADSVRVNDPLHGTQYWVTKTTFEQSWRDFGNQAVIF